jgi:hypothetical protein
MASLKDRWNALLTPPDPARKLADPAEIHISQVGDELYNQYAPNATANCGPATVLMAIRMVGRDVPGADRFRGEALVEYVRSLTGSGMDIHSGTHNLHLQRVLRTSGCEYRVLRDPRAMLQAVQAGEPVIMGGNPTAPGCYTARFDYIDIRRWDSGHWILVSRYNREAGTFTVNDPQSTIGPIEATAQELLAFSSRDGNFGIAVRAA